VPCCAGLRVLLGEEYVLERDDGDDVMGRQIAPWLGEPQAALLEARVRPLEMRLETLEERIRELESKVALLAGIEDVT
jgi:uncharacterized coiled-coil protein SlyX